MSKSGRYGKHGEHKKRKRLKNSDFKNKPSLIKMEERFKISPKHPGKGRA